MGINTERLSNRQGNIRLKIRPWIIFAAIVSQAVSAQSVTQTVITVTNGNNASSVIQGNGIQKKENREAGAFQAVEVTGAINVNYRRADNVHVEVTADQNLLPIISTQVDQEVLKISATQSYQTGQPVTVDISSPHLNKLALSGAGDIHLKGLKEDALRLDVQGSGSVSVEGQAGQFSAEVKGSGKINAQWLESLRAELQIIGSGAIAATVKEALDARITGSGEIIYFGHPDKVEPRVLGSGRIAAGD